MYERYGSLRTLVTGGLGFIGSNLAIRLVELGSDVSIVDGEIPSHGANRFNLAPVEDRLRRVVVADLRDRSELEPLLEGQDVVFDVAGQVSHVDSMADPAKDRELNYDGHVVLLEACRRVNPGVRIVYTGSRQQYGRARYLPFDEAHPLEPVDFNGIHKAAAERAFLIGHDVYGLSTCSLRLTNTYGPRMQMQHPRQGFVAWFVRLALDGAPIELYGGGEALRDFNYVDDVVDALLLTGVSEAAAGEVYNLGHPDPTSVRGFAELLLEVVGGGSVRDTPFPPDRAPIDVGSVHADIGKIERELGWTPETSLRDGLERTIRYYRAQREHYW